VLCAVADFSEGKDALIVELRARLADGEASLALIERDKSVLFDRYSAFRAKYAELTERKVKLQRELLQSEDERLRVSRLLIDLQIENTDLKAQAAKDKARTALHTALCAHCTLHAGA
jgi:hypothetical protein